MARSRGNALLGQGHPGRVLNYRCEIDSGHRNRGIRFLHRDRGHAHRCTRAEVAADRSVTSLARRPVLRGRRSLPPRHLIGRACRHLLPRHELSNRTCRIHGFGVVVEVPRGTSSGASAIAARSTGKKDSIHKMVRTNLANPTLSQEQEGACSSHAGRTSRPQLLMRVSLQPLSGSCQPECVWTTYGHEMRKRAPSPTLVPDCMSGCRRAHRIYHQSK